MYQVLTFIDDVAIVARQCDSLRESFNASDERTKTFDIIISENKTKNMVVALKKVYADNFVTRLYTC